MKKVINFLLGVLIGITLGLSILTFGHAAEQRYTPIVERAMPSVVKITTRYIEAVTDPKTKKTSLEMHQYLGAGVIVSTTGHILTCEHVVSGSPLIIDVVLQTSTSTHYQAVVLRRSYSADIALLKLSTTTFTTAVKLSTEMPKVGDEVIAIGHPEGLEWSTTVGVISGLNRQGLAVNLLQTDAPINPGNSGGPLFNLNGEVVGLNESILRFSNSIGFAVSIDEIRKFLEVFKGLEQAY